MIDFLSWVYGTHRGAAPIWIAAVVSAHALLSALGLGLTIAHLFGWWITLPLYVAGIAAILHQYKNRDTSQGETEDNR